MISLRRLIPLFVLGLLSLVPVNAQVLITNAKQRLNYSEVEVRGETVFQKKKLSDGGSAEVGLPLSSIIAVDWPLPPELLAAETEIDQGSPLAALPALRRQTSLHAPFRRAEGSHWLRVQTALIRALAGAGIPDEAERELTTLKTGKPTPETLASLELDILLARATGGDWEMFAPRLIELRKSGLSERNNARLWLAQADQERRRGQPEKALYSFLQVTVFHSRAEAEQPVALLGSIRCLRAMGETGQARRATDELLRRFPESPQAIVASKEIPSS